MIMIQAPLSSALALVIALATAACSDEPRGDGRCEPDDFDGIVGGRDTFVLTVTDSGFTPAILAAQNKSIVNLTLKNEGTSAHGFVVDCLPTPNDDNCPQQSCFTEEAEIMALEPGGTGEAVFETPNPEGIYRFRSSRHREEPAGQFIIR